MADRITGAELAQIEAALQPTGRDEHMMPERLMVLNRPDDEPGHDGVTRALVAELLRLRGLIVALEPGDFFPDAEGAADSWHALAAEARAISAESDSHRAPRT